MSYKRYLLLLTTFLVVNVAKFAAAQTINYVQQDIPLIAGVTNDAQVNALGIGTIQSTRLYLDGLGRPVQTVALKASPNSNNDIIQVAAYSNIGQQPTKYLPYVDNTGNYSTGSYHTTGINDQGSYYNNNSGSTNKVANDANPYSQKLFEASPLRRLLQEGSIGNGFQPGQHNISYNYRSNSTADAVLMWGTDGTYKNQSYPANSLSVSIAVKADGVTTTITFTDISGHLILKRQVLNGSTNLDTYYIYNSSGNPLYVVPPRAIAIMKQQINYSLTQSGVANLIYSFYYDNLGRLIQKNIPGSAPTYIIYDTYNRPVLIQGGNLHSTSRWYYIKYDVKNRPVSRGIYTDLTSGHTGGTTGSMQSYVTGVTTYATTWYESRTGSTSTYYTNNCFPTVNSDNSAIQDLAYVYYDDYNLTQNVNPDFIYSYKSLPNETATNAATKFTRGMLTMLRKRTVGAGLANIWLINVFFYDRRGNAIQTQSNNHLGSASGGIAVTDYKTNVVDFVGKPLISLTTKAAGSAGATSVKTTLTYDAHNTRLQSVDQVYNSQASLRIVSYEYNEMGQLVRKNLEPMNIGSSPVPSSITLTPANSVTSTSTTTIVASTGIVFSPGPPGATGTAATFSIPYGAKYTASISSRALQSVDYRYNIQGQVININNSTLANDGGATNSDDNDLFGMQIMYDKPDATLNSAAVTTTPSYTGKISAVKWMTVDNNFSKTNERSYVYTYDAVERLTAANYSERAAGSSSTTNFTINTGGFDESGITYDENGNISNLNRNSSTIGSSTKVQVDQLVYSYDPANPNRLLNVSDANNSTNPQYTSLGFKNITGSTNPFIYDANGNLTADPKKGLTLGYNILNKTDNIQFINGPGGVAITGRYINYTYDAAGNVIRKQQYDYVNNRSSLINTTDYIDGFVYVNSSLSYLPMGEGRMLNISGTLKAEYIIADQQGNARFSFQDNGSGGIKIIQENSYYAFGLALANSPVSMPTVPNKQLYNGGSEWQNDYGNLPDYYQTFYRNYDAALGRFIAIDPSAEKYLNLSTYQYSKNNPVIFNDPLGNDPPDGGSCCDVPPAYQQPDPEQNSTFGTPYEGYGPGAESMGSSITGTDEGGNNNGDQSSGDQSNGNQQETNGTNATSNPDGGGWITTGLSQGDVALQDISQSQNDYVSKTPGGFDSNGQPVSSTIVTAEVTVMGYYSNTSTTANQDGSILSSFLQGFIKGNSDENNVSFTSATQSTVAGGIGKILYSGAKAGSWASRAEVLRNVKITNITGRLLGGASVISTFVEDANRTQGITAGTWVKGAIGTAGILFPEFGLIWGAADLASYVISGETLTDRIGNGVDNIHLSH